jgi:hypothetical protein
MTLVVFVVLDERNGWHEGPRELDSCLARDWRIFLTCIWRRWLEPQTLRCVLQDIHALPAVLGLQKAFSIQISAATLLIEMVEP